MLKICISQQTPSSMGFHPNHPFNECLHIGAGLGIYKPSTQEYAFGVPGVPYMQTAIVKAPSLQNALEQMKEEYPGFGDDYFEFHKKMVEQTEPGGYARIHANNRRVYVDKTTECNYVVQGKEYADVDKATWAALEASNT